MALAFFDTHSGIAGDMTLAALVDAGANRDLIQQRIASLGLPNVQLQFSETYRHCFRALELHIQHPPEHAHRHLSDIEQMLNQSDLSDRELDIALRLFRRIGVAEAKVHGTSIEDVHFHEVGAIDSIVDIVGVAVAMVDLGISRVSASPPPTGAGEITIAHGTVNVPAPATAEILRGIPIRRCDIEAELTTPTGAAVLAVLADEFGSLPSMQIQRIGYGAGHKDLKEQANILRVMIGNPVGDFQDEVSLLETNLDDCTAEQIGFAIERLWELPVLDVYTTAIGMKKNRPGVLLSAICQPEHREAVEECIFRNTTSLGIRRSTMKRAKLRREIISVDTPWGAVRVKIAHSLSHRDGAGPQLAPEFEDCRQLAIQHNQTLSSVYQAAINAADSAVSKSGSMPADHSDGDIHLRKSHDHGGHDHGGHDHGGHDHHH